VSLSHYYEFSSIWRSFNSNYDAQVCFPDHPRTTRHRKINASCNFEASPRRHDAFVQLNNLTKFLQIAVPFYNRHLEADLQLGCFEIIIICQYSFSSRHVNPSYENRLVKKVAQDRRHNCTFRTNWRLQRPFPWRVKLAFLLIHLEFFFRKKDFLAKLHRLMSLRFPTRKQMEGYVISGQIYKSWLLMSALTWFLSKRKFWNQGRQRLRNSHCSLWNEKSDVQV